MHSYNIILEILTQHVNIPAECQSLMNFYFATTQSTTVISDSNNIFNGNKESDILELNKNYISEYDWPFLNKNNDQKTLEPSTTTMNYEEPEEDYWINVSGDDEDGDVDDSSGITYKNITTNSRITMAKNVSSSSYLSYNFDILSICYLASVLLFISYAYIILIHNFISF